MVQAAGGPPGVSGAAAGSIPKPGTLTPTGPGGLQGPVTAATLKARKAAAAAKALLKPFAVPAGFDKTPAGPKPSALDQVLPQHIQAALSAAQANLATALGSVSTAQTGKDQIKAAQDLLRASKEYEAQIDRAQAHLRSEHETGKLLVAQQKQLAKLAREAATAEKDKLKAMQLQADAARNIRDERILGVGGSGLPSARALLFRERQLLTRDAKAAGLDTSRFGRESLTQVINDMKKQGFHFSKATLDSLAKINITLTDQLKNHTKDSVVLQNARDRLTQIADTLKGKAAYASNYVPIGDPTSGLGLTKAQKDALRGRAIQSLSHHGKRPGGLAVNGYALDSAYAPVGYPTHTTNHMAVTINIHNANNPTQVAHEVRQILLRLAARGSIQLRGPAAGLNVGLG